jgi:peptidoglycan hydrolase-like protein with peptidoglycan-binding domain
MFFNTGAMLVWGLLWFTIVYIVMKPLGFKLTTEIQKSELNDMNTLRLFLLSFAVFFIIMKLICDSFALPQNERMSTYIIFSLVYIVAWFFIFFRYTFSFSWIFRPYNIFSLVLVSFLVILLGYNNGLWYIIKDRFTKEVLVVEEVVVIEEMNLPWIISGEAQIGDTKKIQYENKLVSSVYNIEDWLSLWSTGQSVIDLQKVLGNLQYFIWKVSGNFGEETRLALRDSLIGECSWPVSTSWVFGPQAKECIDNLKISVPIIEQQGNQEIILAEAEILIVNDDTMSSDILVSEVYNLQAGMALGSVWIIVSDLQKVLTFLGYYSENISQEFDENTRIALRNTLIGECNWPATTSWIFGPQAKQCIDTLIIPNE